jgi:hypothetical protein
MDHLVWVLLFAVSVPADLPANGIIAANIEVVFETEADCRAGADRVAADPALFEILSDCTPREK